MLLKRVRELLKIKHILNYVHLNYDQYIMAVFAVDIFSMIISLNKFVVFT